ncbi:MAG: EAL domain-containing protein [Pseudomonadota bacterium]
MSAKSRSRILKGSLEQRIRWFAFGLSMILALTLGAVTLISQIGHAQQKQRDVHLSSLALLSNTLRFRIDHLVNMVDELSQSPLIWTALADSRAHDSYLSPFLDSLNATHAGSMSVTLLDYQGRELSGAPLLHSSAALLALSLRAISSRQPAAQDFGGSYTRHLLLAFPVLYPPTGDVIGVLIGDIAIEGIINASAENLDRALGYGVTLNGRALHVPVLSEEAPHQGVQADLSHPKYASLYHLQIELFGKHSAWRSLITRQSLLLLFTALLLAWGMWFISSLLARRLTQLSQAVLDSPLPQAAAIPLDEHDDEISLLANTLRTALSEHARLAGQLEELVALRTQELRTSQERYQLAVEGSRDGIWDWDLHSGEICYSARWKEIIGYGADDLQSSIDTFFGFLHPEDRQRVQDEIERHLKGETPIYQVEFRLRHKDGSWRWILSRGTALRDAAGKPYRMAGSHTDITEHRQNAESLLTLSTAIEQSPVSVVIADLDANIEYVNPRFTEITGYTLAEAQGQNPRILQSGHTRKETYEQMWSHLTSGRAWKGELRNKRKNGEFYWEEALIAPVKDANNVTTHYVAIKIDISARKRAEESMRLAAKVFTHAREGIIITDAQANIIEVNASFTQITGYSREEVIGKNPRVLNSGQQDSAFYAAMWKKIAEDDFWQGEILNRRKNGEIYAEWLTLSVICNEDNTISNYLAIFSDITEQKAHQKYIEHIAHYDVLTGLPNRALLADRLKQSMAAALRHHQPLAVAYLDLDGFKSVNDTYGHSMGDKLLVHVASRMKQAVRSGDTIARLGGDEFVAVLQDLSEINSSVPLLLRLLSAASQPVEVDGQALRVSASIGVSYYPQEDEVDADQLLRQADQAMYQAKQAGKNRYHVFDAEQDRSIRGHHERLIRLQRALAQREFELYYQPKVNMRSGAVVGAEALVRWRHPERGLLPPAEFLAVAEEHPLAIELGEWVIEGVLLQLEEWLGLGLRLRVSVNIGARQLQQKNFIERLTRIMASHPQVGAEYLELEVLESSALEDLEQVSRVIDACREMGVKFDLDDFGTGYSSLTYLKRLPADTLKIDQSFVRDMLDDPDALAIVEGVLSLASSFHREAIAEGVETLAHGAMLLRLGCELAQGYGVARPMPAHELAAWVHTWRLPAEWRDIAPLRREEMPLLYAAVEHRAWVKAVLRHVQGRDGGVVVLDEQQCPFAKWLRDDARLHERHSEAIAEVEGLHRNIHALSLHMLELKAQGHDVEAQALSEQLAHLSDTLLERLFVVIGR